MEKTFDTVQKLAPSKISDFVNLIHLINPSVDPKIQQAPKLRLPKKAVKKSRFVEKTDTGLEYLAYSAIFLILGIIIWFVYNEILGWVFFAGALVCYTISIVLALYRLYQFVRDPEKYRKTIRKSLITIAIHAILALAIFFSFQ